MFFSRRAGVLSFITACKSRKNEDNHFFSFDTILRYRVHQQAGTKKKINFRSYYFKIDRYSTYFFLSIGPWNPNTKAENLERPNKK